eukprot:TRINITY_DN454_c0_g1_i6.p1 TRINITY_DN454_c0_g1~~TRINITY_DN454_c0_g1_i6.p1  ORF type:complete len:210 (-),score=25.03 TRINITY_DN454_c0_g1_i6:531-1160(-)
MAMAKTMFPFVFSVAVTLLVLLQSAMHGQATSPEPGTVKITGFSFNGNGCPTGSAEGAISDDGEAITLMFSKYTATSDEGMDGQRRTCTVTVNLSYPPGFIFHLGRVTMRGYAKLDDGVIATAQTSYHISGVKGTARAKHVMKGKFDDNFEFTDNFEMLVYSECNTVRDLHLLSEVRLSNVKPPKSGLVTMDSQDLQLIQRFALVWDSC